MLVCGSAKSCFSNRELVVCGSNESSDVMGLVTFCVAGGWSGWCGLCHGLQNWFFVKIW